MNLDDLKNMVDDSELPLKEGAWEFVESHIPHYPTKKNRWLAWPLFVALGALIGTGLLYFLLQNSNRETLVKETSVQTLKTESIETFNIPSELETPKQSIQNIQLSNDKHSGENPFPQTKKTASKVVKNKLQIAEDSKSDQTADKQFTQNETGGVFKYRPTPNKLNHSTALSNNMAAGTVFEKRNLSPPLQFSIENDRNLKLKTVSFFEFIKKKPLQSKQLSLSNRLAADEAAKENTYFIALNYGFLNTNIYLEPELMKLPKGEGKEINLYFGKTFKNWEISMGVHSARIRQNTSMGHQHDTTYYQVFKPNFETVLPSEYANRLHDTSKLYISGSPHHTAHQEFDILGLSLNLGRTLLSKSQFSVRMNYGLNYKLLKRANTFFYDSINRAAVPFSQDDKGIVFKHLASSRMSFSLNYKLSKHWSFEMSPFADVFHKPFIKHYYKADLLNYGLSLGLRYGF
jgi:hypothetical protein